MERGKAIMEDNTQNENEPDFSFEYGVNPNKIYTRNETAKLMRINPVTLDRYRALHTGLAYIKHGGKYFYRGSDIITEFENNLVQPGNACNG